MENLQNQFQKELAEQRAELEKVFQGKTQAEGEHLFWLKWVWKGLCISVILEQRPYSSPCAFPPR